MKSLLLSKDPPSRTAFREGLLPPTPTGTGQPPIELIDDGANISCSESADGVAADAVAGVWAAVGALSINE